MFTQNWMNKFDIVPTWQKVLSPLKGKELKMLEIGCFEGMSTLWFLENVLTNPESYIDVIDTFEGDGQTLEMTGGMSEIKDRFLHNTERFKQKIGVHQGTSEEKLVLFNALFRVMYDIIYIDGCHLQDVVLSDAVLSWRLLKSGGYMIFDDYEMYYQDKNFVKYEPKIGIDAFLKAYYGKYNIVSVGWQYIIQKI